MADHPILFSGPMVCALLDGRKTQTRRVLKPQPDIHAPIGGAELVDGRWCWLNGFDGSILGTFKVPYAVGDRLWTRESWSGEHVFRNTKPSEREDFAWEGIVHHRDIIWYWADGSPDWGDWEKPRPSIHMPRYASRLTEIVTDVRVQRLQDISEEDAKAEGVGSLESHMPGADSVTHVQSFQKLWDGLNEARGFGWDANPWVAAYTFTVHHQNIYQMEAA